ncbi:MAG: hypothetical protein AMXMBFR58_24030 [Phycisphaerae bacterium]
MAEPDGAGVDPRRELNSPHERPEVRVDPVAPTSIAADRALPTVPLRDDHTSQVPGSHISDAETVIYASRSTEGDLRGRRIGNYKIEDRIGGGGMGVVYLARQDSPRRRVAVKLMRQGITSRNSRARFTLEAELLARLLHPAVAQVYEAGMHLPPDATGSEQEIPFFAMEYVSNAKSLTAYAAANHLSIRDRVKLFVEVCRGVEHGHQRGVIHRDLKPANILVNDAGQPKIIDYGVALCIDPAATSTRHTETGQIIGTIQYMSPEQLSGGGRKLDPRSDVYSLGVVLYELVCRRLPYDVDGRSFVEATRAILEHPPVSPREHIGSIDQDLETIILRALDKDRVTRFQSVAELIDQCEKYLRGEELDISPVSRLTKTWRRSVDVATRRVGGTIVVIVLLVAIVAGSYLAELLHRHTSVNEYILHATLSHASPYAGGVPLKDVRLITVDPSTDFGRASQGAAIGPEPPSFEKLYTVRPLFGRLLERLAALPRRPSVVTFDVMFASPRPGFDEPLAAGIRAMTAFDRSRVPPLVDVVCAISQHALDEQGLPAVAPSLLDAGVRYGSAALHVGADGVSWVHPKSLLIVKNPQAFPIPGLALQTFLSSLYPGSRFVLEIPDNSLSVVASAHEPGASGAAGPGRRKGVQTIPYITDGAVSEQDIAYGIDPGARVPEYEVRMPTPEHLLERSTDLADALAMTDDQLTTAFAGKAVIVGTRGNPNDTFELVDGRMSPGVEIHAVAVASLQLGLSITESVISGSMSRNLQTLLWSGLGAVAGVAIGAISCRSLARRWALILVATACALGGTWLAMRYADTFFYPVLLIIISLVMAAELAAALYRARLVRLEQQPWRYA